MLRDNSLSSQAQEGVFTRTLTPLAPEAGGAQADVRNFILPQEMASDFLPRSPPVFSCQLSSTLGSQLLTPESWKEKGLTNETHLDSYPGSSTFCCETLV